MTSLHPDPEADDTLHGEPEQLPTGATQGAAGRLAELPASQGLLEAGGEGSAILLAAIGRRLEEIAVGQVLEVVSLAPGARMDAVAWCHVTGHELLAMLSDADTTHIWIRKRED